MIDQHKTLTEKFLKKGFWLYIFSFIIAPIGYIIKIILSNELSVNEIGILYGIIGMLTLIGALNDFGLTESINHFIPKYVSKKRYDKVKSILLYSLIIQIITGLIITLFFYFGAEYISINYFKSQEATNILKIFAFFFFGINIFQILSTFFNSIQNTLYQKLVDLIRMGLTLIIILFVFFMDLGNIELFSLSWIVGLYISILFSILLFYFKYYKKYFLFEKILWDKRLFKEIFKYAIIALLGAQAGSILGQMDMQMIIVLLGTEEAGYYTNYLSIIGIPFLLIGPIFGLLFPIFSEMHTKGEHEKIRLVKSTFQSNFLVIGLSLNILFFVFAEIMAYILFGEKFIKSGLILQYSILLLTFNYLLQINFNIMAGIGKIKDRLNITLIAIVSNFILNIILIKSIGVYGAALATGLGWILVWGLSEYFLSEKYLVGIDYKFLTKNIFFMGLLGFFAYYLIIPIFEGLSRGISFVYLFIIGILWFIILGLINYNEFLGFINQLKKFRKG